MINSCMKPNPPKILPGINTEESIEKFVDKINGHIKKM